MALSSASSIGDWRLLFWQRDRIQEVTVDDVQRVAKTYFPPYNRTVGVFIPTDQPMRMEVPAVASIVSVVKDYKGGTAMESGEAFDPSPENLDARIDTVDMNGIKVAMLQKETRGETVNLVVSLRYGNEESLNQKTTAAGMVSSMLMSGTTDLDRQALQAKMDELGVRISPGAGGGGRGRRGGGGMFGGGGGQFAFSIQARRSSIVPAVQLLGDIMRKPAFSEEEFEQSKARSSSMMKRFQTEPQFLSMIELRRSLSDYPQDDVRYVPTMEEMIEQIDNVTLEDVKEIYDSQISTATGEIAIVGEFEPQPLLEALSEVLKDWKSDVEFRAIESEAKKEMVGEKKDVNTPDKANAVFAAGLSFSMNEANDDTQALELGNFILGGGSLSSRLGDRIRQKEGLSYGVGSSISIPSEGTNATFTINAITNPTNIDAVESAAMEELTRFIKEGPTDQEVADAQTAWLEAQKVSRSSDGSIAGQIISNLYLDRTFEYTSKVEKRIAELTAADIQTAFKKYIDPEKLVIIRAGDFETE